MGYRMTVERCECGHEKKDHSHGGKDSCYHKTCTCKKFKAKNHSPRSSNLKSLDKSSGDGESETPEDTPSEVTGTHARFESETEGTFNLSEKIKRHKLIIKDYCIDMKDVKEFIIREGGLISLFINGHISARELKERRDKLAGDELSK